MLLLRPIPKVSRTLRTLRRASSFTVPSAIVSVGVRHASTSALKSPVNRVRNGVYSAVILGLLGFGYAKVTDTRTSFHIYIVPPLLRYIFSGDDVSRPGPEAAHVFGIRALAFLNSIGIPLHERGDHPYLATLKTSLFGFPVNTPLGIAAGLDKHGEAIDALYELSPAISLLEIGCVTPFPQEGNEKPRLFRLPTSKSIINRYGFNSVGADVVARRLRDRVRRYARENGITEQAVLADESLPASLRPGRILAVQVGKNKSTPETDMDAVKRDYVAGVKKLGRYADVLVVNVSSPNTPGLRSLQAAAPLTALLESVVAAAKSVDRARKPKVVVKVSPDSDSPQEIDQICAAISGAGIHGVIVANTTVRRPAALTASPQTAETEKQIVAEEAGGLSGPVLFDKTQGLVGEFRRRLGGNVEIVACGGVQNGTDAMKSMERGANAVTGYTAMVYEGVGWFGRVAEGLAEKAPKDSTIVMKLGLDKKAT